jgi:hypothetical protein
MHRGPLRPQVWEQKNLLRTRLFWGLQKSFRALQRADRVRGCHLLCPIRPVRHRTRSPSVSGPQYSKRVRNVRTCVALESHPNTNNDAMVLPRDPMPQMEQRRGLEPAKLGCLPGEEPPCLAEALPRRFQNPTSPESAPACPPKVEALLCTRCDTSSSKARAQRAGQTAHSPHRVMRFLTSSVPSW